MSDFTEALDLEMELRVKKRPGDSKKPHTTVKRLPRHRSNSLTRPSGVRSDGRPGDHRAHDRVAAVARAARGAPRDSEARARAADAPGAESAPCPLTRAERRWRCKGSSGGAS